MFVHIVADNQNKLSELRALFGSQDRITSALLKDESRGPKQCDAMIVAVDLRNADNIAALKEVLAAFNNTARKIFVIDQKVRLCAAQAYALGATHVLFRPVYQPSLLAALIGSGKSNVASEDDDKGGARGAASTGAASLAQCSRPSRAATGSMSRKQSTPPAEFPIRSLRRVSPTGWKPCGAITKAPINIACW
jgi:hypothetical protein